MKYSDFSAGINYYSCDSLYIGMVDDARNNIYAEDNVQTDYGDYTFFGTYYGDTKFQVVIALTPRIRMNEIHIGSFWDGKWMGWRRIPSTVLN